MKNQMNSHIFLEVVGLGYVAYVIVDSIRSKLNGTLGLSTPVFCLLMAAMIAAEVILAVLVYRTWRKSRAKPTEEEPPETDETEP